jgi:hypothetical protein
MRVPNGNKVVRDLAQKPENPWPIRVKISPYRMALSVPENNQQRTIPNRKTPNK